MYLVSFCNQDRPRRRFALAAFERPGDPLAWIRIGARRRDFGATGVACHNGFVFTAVQSNRHPRLVALETQRWTVAATSPLSQVRDPHSLTLHERRLYIASTGDNAIYELRLGGPRLASERLHYRHPGTADDHDDVHLNSLAFVEGELLVSAFGPRGPEGRWTPDGQVLNTDTGAVLAKGVNQPHSLVCDAGLLMFCESKGGRLHVAHHSENNIAPGTHVIAGYSRGLARTADGILIGVSASHAALHSTARPLKSSADAASCGLWKLVSATGEATHLIDLSSAGDEIYDLLAVDAPMPERLVAWREPASNAHRRATRSRRP